MGAGLTENEMRCRKYRILKGYEKELNKAGVRCSYKKKAVRSDTPNYFIVSFGETVRASNGESFANGVVDVLNPNTNVIEQYRFMDTQKGVDRIKALYGNESHRKDVTDAAWLIVQIERHQRHKDDREGLFLYNADDTLYPTDNSTGLEPGQIYAYNEMREGRPMLRVGPSNQYTEFLPGMTLRNKYNNVVFKR